MANYKQFDKENNMNLQEHLDKNYPNIGLNSEWAQSCYKLGNNLYLFDEMDAYSLYYREKDFIEDERSDVEEHLQDLDTDTDILDFEALISELSGTHA